MKLTKVQKVILWSFGILATGGLGYLGYVSFIKKGGSGSKDMTPKEYGVVYIAQGYASDIMDIRLNTDSALIYIGDTITISNTGGDEGTYTVTGMWGGEGSVKTAYVKHTTTATQTPGRQTPNGKAVVTPSIF